MAMQREHGGMQVVQVYRNLHRGDWSVRVAGKVIAHVERITLADVTFHVGEKARQRVIADRSRSVHAYAKGKVSEADLSNLTARTITYNPYRAGTFTETSTDQPVHRADFVLFADAAYAYGI